MISSKAENLNIRATAVQKARLAEAARLSHMNVSQFVLTNSLAAADEVIASGRVIELDPEAYDLLMARMEEPPREIAALRDLFSGPSVLER